MEFSAEVMLSIANDDTDEFIKVEDQIIDNERWTVTHEMIFQQISTGKFYRSYFRRGATEYQDEGPYEYDGDIITCKEVVKKEVMVEQWVEKKEG